MSAQISVCIVCRNEADKLQPCLESVAWADEVLVMDLESSDGSAELAARHGARVVHREPFPIVEPLRNELAALAEGEWILALDPDERITPGLAQELRRVAAQNGYDAVVIPRMNIDLGYPPSHPLQRYEPQLRMYRRTQVSWPLVPNALPAVPEARKYILPQSDDLVMIHIRNRNIAETADRVLRYAPAQAQSMLEAGETFSARKLILALAQAVDKQFFFGQAWRDGVPGLLRAAILVNYKFYVWAAFWQLAGAQKKPADDRLVYRLGLLSRLARPVVKWVGKIFLRL